MHRTDLGSYAGGTAGPTFFGVAARREVASSNAGRLSRTVPRIVPLCLLCWVMRAGVSLTKKSP